MNKIRPRIYEEVVVNNVPLYVLFDTGARSSYIAKNALNKIKVQPRNITPFRVSLGGKKHIIKQDCLITGTIQKKYTFHIRANVVNSLGKENEREIDMIFGLTDMGVWTIELDIKNKKLDLSHFTKEFIEF